MNTDELTVEMRDLMEGPVVLEVDATPERLDLSDPEFQFAEPVQGKVTFHLVGNRVLADGALDTRVKSQCVRCLGEAAISVHAPFEAIYERETGVSDEKETVENDQQIVTKFSGEAIHPEPELRESVMVELPALPLCRPDCKGLCPGCGVNLNEEECRCSKEKPEESSWAGKLKAIHLDDSGDHGAM